MIKELPPSRGPPALFLSLSSPVRCSGLSADHLRGAWALEKAYNYKMADEESLLSFHEWHGIFKKSLGKQSRNCYRAFMKDIAFIFLGLKPSLLFDYAIVDSENALRLIRSFNAKGLIYRSLDVVQVGEDIFFTRLKPLISALRKAVDCEEFTLINVSGKLKEPLVLEDEISNRVIEQFRIIVATLEQKLNDSALQSLQEDNLWTNRLVDLRGLFTKEEWCIPSMFGFLLGYPVIYWCEKASEDNNLSLVPLNRYKFTFKASSLLSSRIPRYCRTIAERSHSCGRPQSCEHTLFSFTAPVALESSYQSKVSDWIKRIFSMGETLGETQHFTFEKTAVTHEQVSL